MSNTERFSINLNKDRGSSMRNLVDRGLYPTLSSAFDAAAAALLEQEAEKQAWWDEIARRCDEAERYPEKLLLDADTFFRTLHKRIDLRRKLSE